MSRLTACLEDFNRKERYWLIRNALGDPDELLPLSPSFRETIAKETGLDIPADAWWAIDYHIDWLFGAAQSYLCKDIRGDYRKDLLTGSQEDFDFVIAYGTTLIVIEAKAMGIWEEEQYNSKFNRLDRLEQSLFRECGFTLHRLALSPTRPLEKFKAQWIELRMDEKRERFTVLKRSPGGENPTHWQLSSVANPGHKRQPV